MFQGRYKAIMVERESYLLELSRYVVLNPVRAGIVARAADFPWSSHTAILARSDRFPPAEQPTWLETDVVLKQFGARAGVGRPSVWEDVRGQVFLGSSEFVDCMTAALDVDDPKLRVIPRLQRRPAPRSLPTLDAAPSRSSDHSPALRAQRDAAMAAANSTGRRTWRAIADAFGVHEAIVSRGLRRRQADREEWSGG